MRSLTPPARHLTGHLIALLVLLALQPVDTSANALERLFAPKAEYWAFWDAHDPAATAQIDHTAWNTFLSSYLVQGTDGINRVRYAAVSPEDREALTGYIDRLQQQPVRTYNRDQQLAYWINLYNALTVDVVLQHYPVDGIRDIDISPGFFADGPWGKSLLVIEGQAVSLNDIEHRILRPLWQDPRLHYALNCASIGCPNLQPTAFTAENSEALLEQAAHSYVNDPRGVSPEADGLRLSSIYSWFRSDFGNTDSALLEHLRRYAKPGLASSLGQDARIAGYRYDWSLNDAP